MVLLVLLTLIGLTQTNVSPAVGNATEHRQRRDRAARELRDGILLIHAESKMVEAADGFRQDPYFYYFTGLENIVGALLAIDGKSAESWLFLPTPAASARSEIAAEVLPGADASKSTQIEHVVSWSNLQSFLNERASAASPIYFAAGGRGIAELPPDLLDPSTADVPAWLLVIKHRWPSYRLVSAQPRLNAMMEVQSPAEQVALRSAAKSTVTAFMAGLRVVRPQASQRSIEAVVENSCWNSGAHGSSFWPWAMSGPNGVFPHPFGSLTRYDHLDSVLKSGDLVRLDVGCESQHYQGDLGRTLPASGRYAPDQRELWNAFVAAYRSAANSLRAGVTVAQIFTVWSAELLRQRSTVTSASAKRAIDEWSRRENVPDWQIHTTHLRAAYPTGPLRAGMVVNFEPIASGNDQGYFLEDMYLITETGAELLTPGVPYTAEQIEAAMRRR
jgi:Xaa-Pro aminopeptidase